MLVAVAVAAIALGPSGAQAALPDAGCPGPNRGDGVAFSGSGAERFAQTFTAQHDGVVVQTSGDINKMDAGGAFVMQILDVDGAGVPVNGVLGSGSIPESSVPQGVDTTLTVPFSFPAPVAAGHRYALVLTRPGGGSWRELDRAGDPCPGAEFLSSEQDAVWNPAAGGNDWVYQLSVSPPNEFTVAKLGRRSLSVTVPGSGEISVIQGGTGGPPAIESKSKKLLKSVHLSASGSGAVVVPLRLTKRGKALLKRRHKLTVSATITYTPTGGTPGTLTQALKIR